MCHQPYVPRRGSRGRTRYFWARGLALFPPNAAFLLLLSLLSSLSASPGAGWPEVSGADVQQPCPYRERRKNQFPYSFGDKKPTESFYFLVWEVSPQPRHRPRCLAPPALAEHSAGGGTVAAQGTGQGRGPWAGVTAPGVLHTRG